MRNHPNASGSSYRITACQTKPIGPKIFPSSPTSMIGQCLAGSNAAIPKLMPYTTTIISTHYQIAGYLGRSIPIMSKPTWGNRTTPAHHEVVDRCCDERLEHPGRCTMGCRGRVPIIIQAQATRRDDSLKPTDQGPPCWTKTLARTSTYSRSSTPRCDSIRRSRPQNPCLGSCSPPRQYSRSRHVCC